MIVKRQHFGNLFKFFSLTAKDYNDKCFQLFTSEIGIKRLINFQFTSEDEEIKYLIKYMIMARNAIGFFSERDKNNSLTPRIYILFYFRVLEKICQDFDCNHQDLTSNLFQSFVQNLNDDEIKNLMDETLATFGLPKQPNHRPNISNLISAFIENNNPTLIDELNDFCIKENPEILFYPSSYLDKCDVDFFLKDGNNKIAEHQVFLHVDANFFIESYIFDGCTLIEQLTFTTAFTKESRVSVSKYSTGDGSLLWLIVFCGTTNEMILKELINRKIHVHTLYSSCDGIIMGMGGIDLFSIPTPMYALIAPLLGLKRIITQHYFAVEENWWKEKTLGFHAWLNDNTSNDLNSLMEHHQATSSSLTDMLDSFGQRTLMNGQYDTYLLDHQNFNITFYLFERVN